MTARYDLTLPARRAESSATGRRGDPVRLRGAGDLDAGLGHRLVHDRADQQVAAVRAGEDRVGRPAEVDICRVVTVHLDVRAVRADDVEGVAVVDADPHRAGLVEGHAVGPGGHGGRLQTVQGQRALLLERPQATARIDLRPAEPPGEGL